MTVEYECSINLKDYVDEDGVGVSDEELDATKAAIEKAGYQWYQNDDNIEICGEVDVDDYSTSADDVASEIKWILWDKGEIDADVDAREVDSEPDWDKMAGGYDFIWN